MTYAVSIPQYRADIYSTDAILDPYPHYARLRDLGPVVWLSRFRAMRTARPCC